MTPYILPGGSATRALSGAPETDLPGVSVAGFEPAALCLGSVGSPVQRGVRKGKSMQSRLVVPHTACEYWQPQEPSGRPRAGKIGTNVPDPTKLKATNWLYRPRMEVSDGRAVVVVQKAAQQIVPLDGPAPRARGQPYRAGLIETLTRAPFVLDSFSAPLSGGASFGGCSHGLIDLERAQPTEMRFSRDKVGTPAISGRPKRRNGAISSR
jgi:hypothetical protein